MVCFAVAFFNGRLLCFNNCSALRFRLRSVARCCSMASGCRATGLRCGRQRRHLSWLIRRIRKSCGVRRLMTDAGRWVPRRRRQPKVYQPRARRSCLGQRIQIDGSEHACLRGICAICGFFNARAAQYATTPDRRRRLPKQSQNWQPTRHRLPRLHVPQPQRP